MMALPLLSSLIFLPASAAVIVPFLRNNSTVRWFTLVILILDFLITIWILFAFDTSTSEMQFSESREWVPSLGIGYRLGIDGVSVWFIFLTALLGWICVLASWTAIQHRVKEFMASLLAIQSMMIGVFLCTGRFPVLRIVGSDADTDVLNHRHLGW